METFPPDLPPQVEAILTSESIDNAGGARPFIVGDWSVGSVSFDPNETTALRIILRSSSGAGEAVILLAPEDVPMSYSQPFAGEDSPENSSTLAVNLSTLLQETVETTNWTDGQFMQLAP